MALPFESIAEQSRANKSNREKAWVLVMDEAPAMVDEEAWKQLYLADYRIPAPETMDMYCDPSEGQFPHEYCATDRGAQQFHWAAGVGLGEAEGIV